MSDLVIPVQHSHFRGDGKTPLSGDVYGICERVKEIDPNLYVYPLDPPVTLAGKTYNFSITEVCEDRVERLVWRVEALDARVIEHLQYLLHVPFDKRLDEAEALNDKFEHDAREAEMDELYETLGAPMRRQLEHDGFITLRNRSYAKRGISSR